MLKGMVLQVQVEGPTGRVWTNPFGAESKPIILSGKDEWIVVAGHVKGMKWRLYDVNKQGKRPGCGRPACGLSMLHFEAADQDAVDAAQVQINLIKEEKAAAKAEQKAKANAKAERKADAAAKAESKAAERAAAVAWARGPPRPELRLDNWALTYENPIFKEIKGNNLSGVPTWGDACNQLEKLKAKGVYCGTPGGNFESRPDSFEGDCGTNNQHLTNDDPSTGTGTVNITGDGLFGRSSESNSGSVEATFQRPVFVERVRVAPHSEWGRFHLMGAELQVEQDGKWVAVGTGKLSGEDEWIPVSARHAFSGTSLLPEPHSVPHLRPLVRPLQVNTTGMRWRVHAGSAGREKKGKEKTGWVALVLSKLHFEVRRRESNSRAAPRCSLTRATSSLPARRKTRRRSRSSRANRACASTRGR